MKRLLYCLTITCFVNSLANVAYAEPLSQEDVTVLLEAGVSCKDIAEKIREKGYSGKSDSDTLAAIRKKGADVNLLLAIRKPVENAGDPKKGNDLTKITEELKLVRKKADSFPLINASTLYDSLSLKNYVETTDYFYYGFRFKASRSNDKESFCLRFETDPQLDRNKYSFGILLNDEQSDRGFGAFNLWDSKIFNSSYTIRQPLMASKLKTGDVYCVWFAFDKSKLAKDSVIKLYFLDFFFSDIIKFNDDGSAVIETLVKASNAENSKRYGIDME